jgi:hypothetical protein
MTWLSGSSHRWRSARKEKSYYITAVYTHKHSISNARRSYGPSDSISGLTIVALSSVIFSDFISLGNWSLIVFHDSASTNDDDTV